MAKWREKRKKDEMIDAEHKQLLETVQTIRKANQKEYDRMSHALKLYEGKVWDLDDEEFTGGESPRGRSSAHFNTIFSNIEQTAPLITANRPIVTVAPKWPFMEKLGITLNHVLKYAWEYLDMRMLLYRAVKDQMIFGTAIFKCGWSNDNISVELIDPRQFGLAQGYDTIWDRQGNVAPFCFTWAKKPLSWVRDNFPDIEEIVPDGDDNTEKVLPVKFGDVREVGEHTKFVTVYEIWMRDDSVVKVTEEDGEEREEKKYPNGKIVYFTDKQILGTEASVDEHGLPPYVEVHDYIRPHNFLGISEVDQTEGLHKEINRLIKYVSEYTRKNHDPNYMVDVYQLGDETVEDVKRKLNEGGHVISWDSAGGQKDPPIKTIEEGELNPQVLNYLMFLMEIIDIVSGVTDVNRGVVGKQERQSASEIAMLKEAGDVRTMQRVENLKHGLQKLFWMILKLIMQNYTEPRPVSYSDNGARTYAMYGNSYAQAEETMQPRPLSQQAQASMKMGTGTNQDEIARWKQEKADYEQFLKYFKDSGEFDPVTIDFDIEVQSDSLLPTDKQARANLYMRLRSLKAFDVLSLLERLQIPNAKEVVERLKEEMGGGEKQIMAALQKMAQARGQQAPRGAA